MASAINPAGDPQFLAFQRAMNLSNQTASAGVTMRKGQLKANLRGRQASFDQEQKDTLRQTAGDWAARGAFSSSGRTYEQAQDVNRVQIKRNQAALDVQDQGSQLDFDLAQQIARGQGEQSSQSLDAYQRMANQAAKAKYAQWNLPGA